jgi:hypothetical protein
MTSCFTESANEWSLVRDWRKHEHTKINRRIESRKGISPLRKTTERGRANNNKQTTIEKSNVIRGEEATKAKDVQQGLPQTAVSAWRSKVVCGGGDAEASNSATGQKWREPQAGNNGNK